MPTYYDYDQFPTYSPASELVSTYEPPTDDELTNSIKDVLNKKSYSCPICGEKKWTSPGEVYTLNKLEKGVFKSVNSEESETTLFPVIPVTCLECGYVLFFNPKYLIKRE